MRSTAERPGRSKNTTVKSAMRSSSNPPRILFVAPERLRSLDFCLLLKRRGVSLLVVDEAHCISSS